MALNYVTHLQDQHILATACSVQDGLIKMSGRDAGMNISREVSERPGWVLQSGALSHGPTVFHDTSTAVGPLEPKADKAVISLKPTQDFWSKM